MDTSLNSPKLIKVTITKKSQLNHSISLLGQNHGDF